MTLETSLRTSRIEMYREHLEDASFLYEQRNALMSDGKTPWVRLQDFEERLEAQIDALVIGGELALEVCHRQAVDGDAGELYAAVSVFCRNNVPSLLAEVWRSIDFAARDKVRAVTDALKLELPDNWRAACEQALERGDERLVPIISVVCASRRMLVGQLLMTRLASRPELAQPQTISAIPRTSTAGAAARVLFAYCSHADARVRACALKSLLYFGDRGVLRGFYLAAQSEDWPHLALGLGADRSAATVLRLCAEAGYASEDTLLAIGLLGDVSAVRVLRTYLSNEDLAQTAAWALYWITGAPLYEGAFVPEPVDELELLDAELVAWKERGELPRRIDGKPFGHVLQRITCDDVQWQDWLQSNAARFDSQFRYRRGQLYSPSVVLQCVLDESTPGYLRQLGYDELVIRFGCPVAFESDWPVGEQRTALQAIARWVSTLQADSDVGGWQ
jgi:hypothetical protein